MTNTNNENNGKQNGIVFYMRERHYLRTFSLETVEYVEKQIKDTDNNVDILCFKKMIEDVENLYIDLKDNFKHWGVVIDSEREDILRLGRSVTLIFFTTDRKDSCVFLSNENSPELKKMKQEDSFKKLLEIITKFGNIYTPVSKQQ